MKYKPWHFFCIAFAGGTTMSIVEIGNMFASKETPDFYFIGGMIVAGLMGIGGYFISQASNLRSAYMSGISAPQLFNGGLKAYVAGSQLVVSLLTSPFGSPAYAQDGKLVAPLKELKLAVVNNTGSSIWIQSDGIIYPLRGDTSYLYIVVPKKREFTIAGTNIERQIISSEGFSTKDTTRITVSVISIKHHKKMHSALRGIVGQKTSKKLLQDVDIEIEEHSDKDGKKSKTP